jgi:YidC/Oxa1 family membrane protein insertase
LNAWELIIQQPIINVLIVMSHYLGDSFGLAIIALTIIVNLLLLKLTLSQIRSTKAMQALQPKLAELQKKYGKDRQKLSQEQMRLYKESGVKPAGCALTMIIQMPVWIALYQSIMLALAVAPEGLLNLSKYVYSWAFDHSLLPLSRDFLWFNLASPDIFLAVLVGVTMWVQQKMSATTQSADPKQRQQSQMMLWMMPLLFTMLAISFPSGLSLYWVTTSIVRIIIQYRVTGWGGLSRQPRQEPPPDTKRLTFTEKGERKSTDEVGADIVIGDTAKKPNWSRFLPGRDRQKHRPKK